MAHMNIRLTEAQHGQATGTFSNLAPGTYDVRIRDAANIGCFITSEPALVITQPQQSGSNSWQYKCNVFWCRRRQDNGHIPAGGYGTYEYSIDGGITWSTSGIFTNLQPATYDVRIRDAAHTGCDCYLNPQLLITQPAQLNATVAATNVTCFGASDGTISVTNPSGGYGTYEYSINGGGSWHPSGMFTGLVPGNYNVQDQGCSQQYLCYHPESCSSDNPAACAECSCNTCYGNMQWRQ